MTRKARHLGRVTLPTCPTCGIFHPQEDVAQRELCESFALFRDALIPEFGAFVALLPASHATPHIGRFKILPTIDEMSKLLVHLEKMDGLKTNRDAARRLYRLIQHVDRVLRASEFETLDDLKRDMRYAFLRVISQHRQFLLQEFDMADHVHILIEILRSRVKHLKSLVDSRSKTAALLLAQATYFAASHPPNTPAPAASETHQVLPLAQGA